MVWQDINHIGTYNHKLYICRLEAYLFSIWVYSRFGYRSFLDTARYWSSCLLEETLEEVRPMEDVGEEVEPKIKKGK